jgi:hypothetical protein
MKPNKFINPDMPVSKMAVINSIVLLDYRLLFRAEKTTGLALSKSIFQKPVVLTHEQAKTQMSLKREHAKLRKALKETNKLSENVSKVMNHLNQAALDFHPRRPMPEFYAEGEGIPLPGRGSRLGPLIRQRIATLSNPSWP